MIEITELNQKMDRWYYSATFTHNEFTKQIKGGYFEGSLTEEEARGLIQQQYNYWIEWLT